MPGLGLVVGIMLGLAEPATPPAVVPPYSEQRVKEYLAAARADGDARRGAQVFALHTLGCLSCHVVAGKGGAVGPDLSTVSKCITPEETVEAVFWPKRKVKPEFIAVRVTTADGKSLQGYVKGETDKELTLVEPGTDKLHRIKKSDIEERGEIGSLMPETLGASLTPRQRNDLLRFLLELGKTEGVAGMVHDHTVAKFEFERTPLHPEDWPNWQAPVNRGRIYDFYAKEADYFLKQKPVPLLLPEFHGLDGGKLGHWGNQKESDWADDRWNQTDLGSVMCGVFRGADVTVPKAVCVRLGERGELAACFNPETLAYEAVWSAGFVKFSSVRHGFMHGLALDGKPLPKPEARKVDQPFTYHGFYRYGKRVVFSYKVGDVEMLDAPWVEDGKFVRQVGPASKHPLAALTRGGPAQWPHAITTAGAVGKGKPYALDTITLPFKNPWNALLFFGGHDFLPDGTAVLCTMQGDVWLVSGLDASLERVRWRRFATGLHQALGVVVADQAIYVLGRDQITRLADVNGDGEADFYECFSNAYTTSPAGHDFICGLERDADGNFYTASGNQGLIRITRDGKKVEVIATGFRNPDGLGRTPEGYFTVPCSEGEWTPASMVAEVRPRQTPGYFGYGGPRDGKPPELPLVYLPRSVDNSSGGQIAVPDERWGPMKGQMLHLSYGMGTHMLLLRDEVQGQPQGGVVPLPGEFHSGAHRGRFNPRDGQLYVCGMGGWSTYTIADGCFQRVRFTGDPVRLPVGFHVHENGIVVRFSMPLERDAVAKADRHFAQCWNYRYSAAYGSPEFSPHHPGTRGHDSLEIRSAHVVGDGRSLFLEIPELQPVSQLHLRLTIGAEEKREMFLTVHKLDAPFKDFPGYKPSAKIIAAHPILSDIALAAKRVPNPFRKKFDKARTVEVVAGKNLTFETRSITVKAGEPIALAFKNPDVVPHNWVLVKPGALDRVGDLANKIVADPEAAARHYVPNSPDVIVYTDIVGPLEPFTIYFHAPKEKGRYPYLCTFPGHWMVMNGVMIVE